LEDKSFVETNVPLVSQISSVPIIPLIPKNNNINFNLIDNSDKEYFRSLGLDMVGNAEQMKVFFEAQTQLVRAVIFDIITDRLNDRSMKEINKLKFSGRTYERENNKVNLEKKQDFFVNKGETKYRSIQFDDFKKMVQRDSSYVNRINAGGVTTLLQELKIQFDLFETNTGMAHERVFKVKLEVFGMEYIGISNNIKEARNAAKKNFIEAVFAHW